MQDDIDIVERDYARQSMGEILKQLAKVAMRGDCFRNLKQRLVPFCESLTWRYGLPIHRPLVWPIAYDCSRGAPGLSEEQLQ